MQINDTNNPNQLFPITYKGNGYIDILRSVCILRNGNLYGKSIEAFITPPTIEIDTLEDLEYANWYWNFKGFNYKGE